MRGETKKQSTMLSLRTPDERVPADHPLRRVKDLADGALGMLSETFEGMYSQQGRPSIPPEQLLKASLLMAFYSVRSERLFCEQLDYNLLFRWFLDMGIEDASFDHSTFSANRQRLLEHEVAKRFFAAVVEQARKGRLMSDDHFSVDGSLIEAWASVKSFRPKAEDKRKPPDDPGNPSVNFRGEKRSNEKRRREGSPAGLHGERPHGEQEWALSGLPRRAGRRLRRAPGSHLDAESPQEEARHCRGRQGLRHGRLRPGLPRTGSNTSRGADV